MTDEATPALDGLATTLHGEEHTGSSDLPVERRHDSPELLARGDLVGRYVVLARLGEGGMGVVYAAYDPDLDRKVAVKLLHPGRGDDEEARVRLLREAQAMAQLAHPNVVAVHDVGAIRESVWIAMEFVDGRSLKDWLAEAPRDWRDVLPVFIDAGEGLRAAHAAGLVHRDFKPENVMIGADGRVRVVDFGLARSERSPAPAAAREGPGGAPTALATALTLEDDVVGTPRYMAPEQWRGAITDGRTDQFAFCVALWEGVHRARPFAAVRIDELAAAVLAGRLSPPANPRAPGWLHEALVRGLQVDPARRWPAMAELLDALRRGRARSHGWRRIVAVAAVALAIVGVIAGQFVERAQRRQHAALQDVLHEARTHAAAVLGDVIGARAGLLADYDPLVRGVRRLERLQAELEARVERIGGPHAAELRRVVAQRRREGDQAAALLERFKARHAVLHNSSLYFPVIVAETASGVPELDEQLVALLRELLRFDASAREDLQAEVRAGLDALTRAPVTPERRAGLDRLRRHAELILDHRVEVDRIIHELSVLQDDRNDGLLADLIRANDAATTGPDDVLLGVLVLAACGLTAGSIAWLMTHRRRRGAARRGR